NCHRCEDGPPPREREQEQDIPVEQRARPATHHAQEHVVEDVPYPKGHRTVAPSRSPCSSREHANRKKHEQRRHFPDQLNLTENALDGQRIRLIGFQTIDEGSKIVNGRRFQPRHCDRKGDDDQPARVHFDERAHRSVTASRSLTASANARMRRSTSSITSSGVDVPAVIPTVRTSTNQPGGRSEWFCT